MSAGRSVRAQDRDSLEVLRKVLQLERKLEFQNKAVAGGLDSLLRNLLSSNGIPNSVVETIRSLPSGGYHQLSGAERARWIDTVFAAATGKAGAAKAPVRAAPRLQPKAPVARERSIDDPVTVFKGVKERQAEKFEKLGVHTVRDLLYFFPRRYNDFSKLRQVADLQVGEEATVRARVWEAKEKQLGRTIRGTEATVGDESGMMRVVWFRNPWVAKQLKTNAEVVLSGRVSLYKGRPTFENPEWELWAEAEELTHAGRLVPVYPSTAGLTGRMLRRTTRQALDLYLGAVPEALPEELRNRLSLMGARRAVLQAHYPDDEESIAQARRRLALEELLPLQLSVLLRLRAWQEEGSADPLAMPREVLDGFVTSLPFVLTGAQEKALDQLLSDLARGMPMSRLLQGDVGSGKTVVAAAGLAAAAANGNQSALMAPTEILAEQHFRTLCDVFGADAQAATAAEASPSYLGRTLRIALLTGSVRAADKARIYEQIEAGEIDIVVGTHALIQKGVSFNNLGFIIVDEQHRFGVMQRAELRGKSERSAHLLVMSATPIPRSLYLTLYGDLDVSAIDELPPGRKPIVTKWWPPEHRQDAYDFLRHEVDEGRQAFVICPLVEESATLQSKSAVQEYERLRSDIYPDLRLDLVHGRMKGKEKEAAMQRFRTGEVDILVSTSVIEVGIDVPNASVMLIEGADRFGLAQLHQFRGRVGRGADQSYCLLLAESPSLEAQQRLRLMEETSDGFRLAEADLNIRGPGEFFGTRQSGLPDFRIASLLDTRLIELARSEAARMLEEDPDLSKPEHALLASDAARLFERVTGEVH